MKYSLISLLVLVFYSCHSQNQNTSSDRPPNIVFILADDLGYGDISINGQKKFTTPHIDRLAKEGKIFTQHYAGSTVCSPSRSAFLTGQHTGHTPIRINKGLGYDANWSFESNVFTIAEMLQEKGYVSGIFGKWGLGGMNAPGNPLLQGFDRFYGYNSNAYAHSYYPHYLWDDNEQDELLENTGTKKGMYSAEIIHEKAKEFITKNKEKPLFVYYATTIPHAELVAPEDYMAKFRGKFLPEKKYQGELVDSLDYRTGPYESQPESHAAFAAMVTYLDDQVGDLMQFLEAEGLAENTLVIFTSDNGPHIAGGGDPLYFDGNGPYRGIKRDLYEGGIRVPLIAYWPDHIQPGTSSDLISANWDFMPTFAELAQVNRPDSIDGISILPTLLDQGQQEEHDYLYWEFKPYGGQQAVRKGKWKGVKSYMDENPNAPLELYDLEADPGETKNVAKNHPDIVTELNSIILQAHVPSISFPFEYEKYSTDR